MRAYLQLFEMPSYGNAFIITRILSSNGVCMRFTTALITVFLLFILSCACSAQLTNQFQRVGGDFGQSWISDFKAQNRPAASENLTNDLWNWGNVPKGKTVVDGKLVDSTNKTAKVNYTANWLGDIPIGMPVYFNSSSPYGNYGRNPYNGTEVNTAPFTPMSLSDDPWILAQQLERPVSAPKGYYAYPGY